MNAGLRFTILGCGSSGGVPRVGGNWGACDPDEPRNFRKRCSLLVQRLSVSGATNVLIDTSPDLRVQLLDAGVGVLDAVVYTHEHADHTNGLDDLRIVAMNREGRIPVYASHRAGKSITKRFGYAFEKPPESLHPPFLDLAMIETHISVDGPGGQITMTPIEVEHGNISAFGFRIGRLAYLPDVSSIPGSAWREFENLDCWIVDALRRRPHPAHSHLGRTLEWIERAAPRQALLTNMHTDLDYETICQETPSNVAAAYDGLRIEYPDPESCFT